jgi:hypothetical protein
MTRQLDTHGSHPPALDRWGRWLIPLTPIALGGVILAAEAADDDLTSGLIWFAVLTAIGLFGIFGGRFEAVREARGETEDERDALINARAMSVAGTLLILALTGCVVYQLARGRDASPYVELLAVGGAAYGIALVVLRRLS